MLKKHTQLITSYILAADLLVIAASWILAYCIRFYSSLIPVTMGIPPFSQYFNFIVFLVIIWTVVFKAVNTYSPMYAKSGIDEFCEVLKISTISVLLLIVTTFFYREHSYSRTVMVLFWIISSILLTVSHAVLKRIILKLRKRGYNIQRVLIIGAGDLGKSFAKKVREYPEIGIEIIGFVSDHREKVGRSYDEIQVLGHVDDIKSIMKEVKPDELFVALPLGAHERLEKVIQAMDDETIDIKIVPDLHRFMRLNGGVENFYGMPIINLSEGPLWGWNKIIKRLLDIVFSSIAIILFSPVMLIIAICIKIASSAESVCYRQERMGLDGKRFVIYKFRSMITDAERETGAVWAAKNDQRRTKIGRLLRRTSLDELPQFFNVLKGDMSFVGPRPERPVFVEEFKKSVPLYMLRHKMKTGITGWAQVNGWRGNTSMEKRIEYDLYYIENWSLKFDLKIMWLTVWKGFVDKNAY